MPALAAPAGDTEPVRELEERIGDVRLRRQLELAQLGVDPLRRLRGQVILEFLADLARALVPAIALLLRLGLALHPLEPFLIRVGVLVLRRFQYRPPRAPLEKSDQLVLLVVALRCHLHGRRCNTHATQRGGYAGTRESRSTAPFAV